MKLTNNQLTNSPINQQFFVLSCKSCRNHPLQLSRELYKSTLFMQNKAKLQNTEMNVTALLTRGSEVFRLFSRRKNKPKQSQNKAKLQNDEMNVTSFITKGYINFRLYGHPKNKPKQSQFKPNFGPKLASFSQFWLCYSPKSALKQLAKYIFTLRFKNLGFVVRFFLCGEINYLMIPP